MGDDTKILGILGPHDALLLGVEGQVRPATSLTDSGTGGGVSLDYERWRGTHGVSFGIGYDQATTRGKLYPSSETPGAYTENTHSHFWLRLGNSARNSLGRKLSSTHVGFGTLTDDPPARSDAEDGEIIDLPKHTYSTITIARETGGGLEFRPTPRFGLLLEAGLRTSLLFDVDGSNDLEEPSAGSRLGAALFVRLRGGVGDVVDPEAKDTDVGALELTNLLLAEYLIGSFNTWGQYENFQRAAVIFGKYYEDDDDAEAIGGGAELEDIGLLQGVLDFTAKSDVLDLAGRLSRQSGSSATLIALPILEGARCAIWLGLGSGGDEEDEALIGAGLAGCARAATLGMIAGRQSTNSIFLTRLGLSALMMGMGELGQLDGNDYHVVLEGLSLAGFSTFMELWSQPDPTGGGLVRSTVYGFSPVSLFSGGGRSGARGTIFSRSDLHVLDDTMALQLSLASPLFAATNAGKRVAHEFDNTITGPLDGTGTPTTLRAELQFAGELELGGGVALRGHVGPHILSTWRGLDSAVGVGGQTGFSLEVPVGESRLGFGVNAYLSTSQFGNEMELTPVFTIRWGGESDEDVAPTPEEAPAPAAPARPNPFLLPPPDPKPRVNPFLLPPKKQR